MYAGYPYAGGPWGGWSLALVADNETARPSANREGAISLTGMARVSVDPPLSPIPEELRGKEMLVGQQFEAPAIVGTRAVFSPQRASIPRPQDRIVIGGMDVTYWRGIATPLPDWQYVEPLGWGTCTIDLPQVVAAYEQPGQGELSFLAPGKPVRIERHVQRLVSTTYSEEVIADSPKAYWSMEDASGVIQDLSGNENHLTITGAPEYLKSGPTDLNSSVYWTNGSRGQATKAISAVGGAMTIETWVKIDTLPSSPVMIASDAFQFDGGMNNEMWFWLDTAGRPALNVYYAGTRTITGPALTLGEWAHVVATHTGSIMSLYVNGQFAGSMITGATAWNRPPRVHGGRAASTDDHPVYFAGMAIYDRVLGGDRILAHLKKGRPSGSGTVADPWVLTTESHLSMLSTPGHYALGADIAVTSPTLFGPVLNGSFDGRGHVIDLTGVTVQPANTSAVGAGEPSSGFFLDTLAGSTLKRVGLIGGTFTANSQDQYSAPLASSVRGVVTQCFARGGTVITSGNRAGGLIGVTQATATVSQCYSASIRSGAIGDRVGGMTGFVYSATPSSYFDSTVWGSTAQGGGDGALAKAAARTTALMKQVSNYVGWDFSSVWSITEGVEYPSLIASSAPPPQEVFSGGELVDSITRDYRGVIIAHDVNGGSLSVEIGGHATGPAALRDVQPPLIQRRVDLGKRIAYGIRALHRQHEPPIGATTGIQVLRKGGMNHLDYLNDIIGSAQTVDGKRWTTMPNEDGVYSTFVKDQTTKHFTVYHDDAVNRLEVRRDVSEEPNRAFVRLVTPGGMVVRYGAYPGLLDSRAAPYPFNDGRTFSQGTTDANTDSGDGITVMIWRLIVMGYISERAPIGTYDADITRAIRKLQKDVELPVTGTMNVKTWRRLFDLAATGYSTRRARILPAAQTPETKRWRRTASGSVVGKNKKYDPRILKVDRTVDFGATWTREQGDDFAESILSDGPQWVGSLTLESGAVIRGAHVPGVEITPEDLMPTRDIRPGMNVWIPHFAGGTLFHVSGVSVSNEGRTVTLVVDTKARDAMAAWSVIQRNRDNRNTPHRSFMQQHRKSMGAADNEFDEVGGKVERTRLEAGWNVIPVVAKQAGTINRTNIQLSANTEFAVAVFGRRTSRKRLRKLNPNPLTPAGTKLWRDPVVRKSLDEVYHVMYVAGGDEEPCGYSPAKKSDNKGLTGRWMDDASWPFYSFTGQNDAGSVLWLAIYVSVDCYLQGGRVFWPITEDY